MHEVVERPPGAIVHAVDLDHGGVQSGRTFNAG